MCFVFKEKEKLVTCFIENDNKEWFEVYNEEEDGWSPLVQAPVWMDDYSMTCVYPRGIVVVGAGNSETGRNCCLIDFIEKKEKRLPQLASPMCCSCVVHDRGVVTVAGGQRCVNGEEWIGTQVVYNLEINVDDTWKEDDEPLPYSATFPMTACSGEYVYYLGGTNHPDELLTSVYRHNKRKSNYTVIQPLPEACNSMYGGVCIQGHQLLVVAPTACMVYKSQSNEWMKKSYEAKSVDRINVVSYAGGTLAAVQYKDYHQSRKLELYDCNTNKWTVMSENGASPNRFYSLRY